MKTSTRDVIRTLILSLAIVPCSLSATAAASLNGSAGIMPAYYDGRLFTINFKEEPGVALLNVTHDDTGASRPRRPGLGRGLRHQVHRVAVPPELACRQRRCPRDGPIAESPELPYEGAARNAPAGCEDEGCGVDARRAEGRTGEVGADAPVEPRDTCPRRHQEKHGEREPGTHQHPAQAFHASS